MKTIHAVILVLCTALATGCGVRTPIYRAKVKLLITRSTSMTTDVDEQFRAEQIDMLMTQMIIKRVQISMKKTPEEIRNSLTDLKAAPVRGSDIILVSVDSPSADFAKEFANVLAQEYLKLRDEKRAETSETALQPVIREVHDLNQQLKAINERLAAFDKEHDVSANPELSKQKALYEDHARVQSLYSVSLAKLMKMDKGRSRNEPSVTILESAVLEPKPVNRRF